MRVNLTARAPDDENYMVIFELTPDGESRLIGYIRSSMWQRFMEVAQRFHEFWQGYLNS